MVYVVEDILGISSTLRARGIPIRHVSMTNFHSKHEVFSQVASGNVMGIIAGLVGPGAPAHIANHRASQSTNNETANTDNTRNKAREHSLLLELLLLVYSRNGFILLVANARNQMWKFTHVRSLIDNAAMNFTILDAHTCTLVRTYDTCTTLRIATTLQLPTNIDVSTHAPTCARAPGGANISTNQQHGLGRQSQAETDDVATGPKAFDEALIVKILLPAMEMKVIDRLSNAQRFPMTGPNEPVDEELGDVDGSVSPRVRHESPAISLPTAQAIKYKKKLKESGRTVVARKRAPAEQHFDDCGSDVSSLMYTEKVPESSIDTFQFYGLEPEPEPDASIDFDFSYIATYLNAQPEDIPSDVLYVSNVASYLALLAKHRNHSVYVDIAEVMGGEARTTQLLVRRNYKGGKNFDCVVGIDLMRRDEEYSLYRYLYTVRPFVLVMAPQCTGMAGWGRFNASVNPEAHQRSVYVSRHLGRICARCAHIQLDGKRHFFNEQPKGSDLYQIYEWQLLLARGVLRCYVDMCMVGLRSRRRNLPLKKPSELWASDWLLLARFRNRLCNGKHTHDTIEGGESKPSQIWTWTFARLLADGIADLIRAHSSTSSAFPAGRPALPPAVDPSEVVPDDPRLRWSCRACRNGIEKHDSRHTRDPEGCRWPLDEGRQYSCEGCQQRRGRADPSHSFVPGECRLADPDVRGRDRQRQGGVWEPRVPASSAPGAGLRDSSTLPEHVQNPDTGGASGSRSESNAPLPPPAAAPGDVPEPDEDPDQELMPDGRGRPPSNTRTVTTQAGEGVDWSKWDLGRAIRGLRSASRVVVCNTLRQIHNRLWHAPAKRLRDLLHAAGLPQRVLDEVQNVVDTCRTCREWQRHTDKPVASLSISTRFNDTVQFDLLFLDDGVAAHMICCCIRWAQGAFIESRETHVVLEAISHFWFRVYGAPKVIISDQEGALFSDEGGTWAMRWKIELKAKPKGSHAAIIERRNELLRQQYHKVRSQAQQEGLKSSKTEILDESLLACNAMLSVHGVSPYEALFGRSPNLLQDLHSEPGPGHDDTHGGNSSRHIHRLREISLSRIVQGHAEERLKLAARSQTRRAVQTLNLKPGDLVEFYRAPLNKDVTGWRGPATVVSLDRADEGIVEVRWQSRVLPCRMPDIRRALDYYLVFLVAPQRGDYPEESPWLFMMIHVEQMEPNSSTLIGFEIGDDGRWRLTTASNRQRRLLHAVFFTAACDLHLTGVVAARLGYATQTIPPGRGYISSLVFWWTDRGREPSNARISPAQPISSRSLFGESFGTTRWIQFLVVAESTSEGLRSHFPEIPNIGTVYNPQYDTRPDNNNNIDIDIGSNASQPSSRHQATRRPRSPYDEDEELDRPSQWRCLPNSDDETDDNIQVDSDSGLSNHNDLDMLDATMDTVVRSQSSTPMDKFRDLRRQQHRSLVRRFSKRRFGYGPDWGMADHEFSFYGSLATMTHAPDPEFMIPGYLSMANTMVWNTSSSVDQYVELELDRCISLLVDNLGRDIALDEHMVFRCESPDTERVYLACIEKEADALTPEQLLKHAKEVDEACLAELRKWTSLGALKIRDRLGSPNIMDSRWVIRFKRMPDGSLIIKCRLCIRGFKDGQIEMLDTFAGTASRYGQRAVNIVAATKRWIIWSLDVGQAFLKGLTFEQVSKMTGTPLRSVQLTLPKGAAALLQKISGYEKFDPVKHVLDMIRPGFGLKDAPRLWHLRIDEVLKQLGTFPLVSDPQLYARWDTSKKYSFDSLELLCSKHVDDLKGASSEKMFDELCIRLKEHFGDLTIQKREFEHLGIIHKQLDDYSVECSQDHYVKQLRLISLDSLPTDDDSPVSDTDLLSSYQSLVGGSAWTLLTRSDVAVQIGHLQRQAHQPCVADFKTLNTVVRWMKRMPCTLRHVAIPPPWSLLVMPDSAFKATEPDCLAIRACVIVLSSASSNAKPTLPHGGPVGVVEFYSRKQPRVCRSTFAAELCSVDDASSIGLLIRGMFSELLLGPMRAGDMARRTDIGDLIVELEVATDHKGLFAGATATEVKIPSEPHLLYLLKALRDRLDTHSVDCLWWFDTRDMICDAMTKGTLPREPLLRLWRTATLTIAGEQPVPWRSGVRRITTNDIDHYIQQHQAQQQLS